MLNRTHRQPTPYPPKKVEDSPYLMIGTSQEHAEQLGVSDLGTALGLDDDDDDYSRAVEMGAVGGAGGRAPFGGRPGTAGSKRSEGGQQQQQQQERGGVAGGRNGDAKGTGWRDQIGAGAAAAAAGGSSGGGSGGGLPLSRSAAELAIPNLPPVRTRVPEPPRFSLGDEEAFSPMDEIRLHSSSPPKKAKVAQD